MVKKLLALNGIAILGAVLYHSAGWGFISMFWWTDRYQQVTVPNFNQIGSFSYFGLRFIEQIIILAIPAFLFVSGYFVVFASGKNPSPKWKWIFTRISFLVIPYLIWTAVMIIFNSIFGEKYTLQSIVNMTLTGKAVEAFYFIPLIVQLYLLSPLITRIAKRRPILILLFAFILQTLVKLGQYAVVLNLEYPLKNLVSIFLPSWFFPGNLFWFVLGITAAYHLSAVNQVLVKWRWFFLIILICLIPIGMIEWESLLHFSGKDWIASRETLIDNFYSFSFLIVYFTFSLDKIIKWKWLNFLGSRSFGIYLAHTLFLMIVAKSAYHFIPVIFKYQLAYQPLLIFSGLFGPIVLMEIFKRTPLKKFYGYVFG
jgi:surface polysaccharide O-acyltransferase-like enzyme